MNITEQDYKAMELLLKSEGKKKSRNVLLKKIEKEISRSADKLDPEYIGALVDSLYTLDNTSPPRFSKERLEAAVLGIKRRAIKQTSGFSPQRSRRRILRGVSAACAALLLLVFANFGAAWATGRCLLKRIDITFCCHTIFCIPADNEETPANTPSNQEYQDRHNNI